MPRNSSEIFYANGSEDSGEILESTNRERGEMTLSAEDEMKLKEIEEQIVVSEKIIKDYDNEESRLLEKRKEFLEGKETINNARRSPFFRKWATRIGKVVGVGVIAGLTIFGAGQLRNGNSRDIDREQQRTEAEMPEEEVADGVVESANAAVDRFRDNSEAMEAEKGINDGYDEKGMWLSSEKDGAYDFAAASEVAEVCNNDEVEMVKYTADNEVEAMADYVANLPEQVQSEAFKGLGILETETKLESLTDDQFDAVKKQFFDTMDKAFTRRKTVNGPVQNALMRLKDPNGEATHENMELVACQTNEHNTELCEFYWTDDGTGNGNEIGSMMVKIIYDEDGNIIGCIQVVNEIGSEKYNGMTTIKENPPVGKTTEKETPPEPENESREKNAENLVRIDNNINERAAEDNGTGKIEVNQTPKQEVDAQKPTEKPASNAYEATEPTIVQNNAAQQAEPVQQQVSPANSYSENRGGANANEYAPVQTNQAAQDAADTRGDAQVGADQIGNELGDILN